MLIALFPLVAIGIAWRNIWTSAATCSDTSSALQLLPRVLPVAEP